MITPAPFGSDRLNCLRWGTFLEDFTSRNVWWKFNARKLPSTLLKELKNLQIYSKCSDTERDYLVTFYDISHSHTEQNKCHPNPCRNGGTCTGINEGEGFECTCREGFKGKNCEGNLIFFFHLFEFPYGQLATFVVPDLTKPQAMLQEDMSLSVWACAIKIWLKIICFESFL